VVIGTMLFVDVVESNVVDAKKRRNRKIRKRRKRRKFGGGLVRVMERS
jgi:hypothetical protein